MLAFPSSPLPSWPELWAAVIVRGLEEHSRLRWLAGPGQLFPLKAVTPIPPVPPVKAGDGNTHEQASPPLTAHRNTVTNQSAFLSPRSSGWGSQVQRIVSDSFFPIPQRQLQFKNTESTSHPAQTEPIPGAGSVQGPGRTGENKSQARAGTCRAPPKP